MNAILRYAISAIAIALALLPSAHAAIYTVGGAGCTHGSIAEALVAAEQSPGADTIRLSRMLDYTAQQISFSTGQELEIAGGYDTCTSPRSGNTVLDGAGGDDTSVLSATLGNGSVLTLRNLTIRNGDAAGDGGGLWIRTNGAVRLYDTIIVSNRARLGGGIFIDASGDTASLQIGEGTQIGANVARRNGGGIYADDVIVRINEPRTYIFNNVAEGLEGSDGLGGGVLLRACNRTATVFVAGEGLNGAGIISANRGARGGGIAVVVGDGCSNDYRGYAQIYRNRYGTAKLFNNVATLSGGGLYIRGNTDSARSIVFIRGAIFEGNVAPRGAAMQVALAGDYGGSDLFVNQNVDPVPGDASPCPDGEICTRFLDNVNADQNGVPTTGATLETEDNYGRAHIGQALFARNRGNQVLRTALNFRLESSAVVGNVLGEAPIVILDSYDDYREARFQDVTIAGNTFTGDSTIRVTDRVTTIERSILWQPGKQTITESSSEGLTAQAVIASEVASLAGPDSGRIVTEAPRFVDPANGDYELQAASPAVDFLESLPEDDRDLAGLRRDVGLATVPNRFGPRDLGAFERQSLLPVIVNGEVALGSPLGGWELLVPQAKYSADNAPGSPSGTGSIQLEAGVGTLVEAARQCVAIPGPETWYLNGSARTLPGVASARDSMGIAWTLHRGANCTGSVIAQGVKALGSAATWLRPAQPVAIPVSPADWTRDTSLALVLRVGEGSLSAGATANGWFDQITLDDTVQAEAVFMDGFE